MATVTLSASGILNASPGGRAALVGTSRLSTAKPIASPLRQAVNTHLFTDSTAKPTLLYGSHTWNTLQDWAQNFDLPNSELDFDAFVTFLLAHGHTSTVLWRHDLHWNWASQGGIFWITPWPWNRPGPGLATDGFPKFDLSSYNQEFFDRLRHRVRTLLNSSIYAIVQLFGGQDLVSYRHSQDAYPFTLANNINAIDDGGGLGSVNMVAPNAITAFQVAYMQKAVDTLNDLPNVIWRIDNQGATNSWFWRNYMIDQLRAYEITKSFQHAIGDTVDAGLIDASNLYTSDADLVSPVARVAPVANQGKLIVGDSDNSYPQPTPMRSDAQQINRNVLWQNACNAASYVFMDGYLTFANGNLCSFPVNGVCASGTDTYWEDFRTQLGYVANYMRRFNTLLLMTPQVALSSTTWCLANTATIGSELLVYAPGGGPFTVNLTHTSRTLNAEWFNPVAGTFTSGGTVSGGSSTQSFATPWGTANDAVLYLVDPSVLAQAVLSGSTLLTPTLLTQKTLPIADTANLGAWVQDNGLTTTNLFSRINEAIPNDATFIESPPGPAVATYVTRLASPMKPQSGPILVHTRLLKDLSGLEIDLTVDLLQGASVIQTWTHLNVATTVAQFDDLVTNPITDWITPFDVRVTANQV